MYRLDIEGKSTSVSRFPRTEGRLALTISCARRLPSYPKAAQAESDLGWICEATISAVGPPVCFWTRADGISPRPSLMLLCYSPTFDSNSIIEFEDIEVRLCGSSFLS